MIIDVISKYVQEACADSIAQITNPVYWLYFAFTLRKLSYREGIKWYSDKIDSNWNGLISLARESVADKYRLVKSLLQAELGGSN